MNRELIVHIHSIIGILIFVTGLLQIVLKKSGSVHKTIGKVYVCAWLVLLITGAYLGGLIITTIGIFGFYFALTGSRIGHLKNKPITLFEKAIFIIGGLVALSMLYFSASLYLKGQSSFAIIFAIFGTIFLFTTANDIFFFEDIGELVYRRYSNLLSTKDHIPKITSNTPPPKNLILLAFVVSPVSIFNETLIKYPPNNIIETAKILLSSIMSNHQVVISNIVSL